VLFELAISLKNFCLQEGIKVGKAIQPLLTEDAGNLVESSDIGLGDGQVRTTNSLF
jgi:hypothetical protein